MDKKNKNSTDTYVKKKSAACWACAQKIENKQLICLKCNSWQGRRRYFKPTNITLSLLLAIGSVFAVSIPIYKSAVETVSPAILFSIDIRENKIGSFGNFKISAQSVNKHNAFFSEESRCIVQNDGDVISSIILTTNEKRLLKSEDRMSLIYSTEPDAKFPETENTSIFCSVDYFRTTDGNFVGSLMFQASTEFGFLPTAVHKSVGYRAQQDFRAHFNNSKVYRLFGNGAGN